MCAHAQTTYGKCDSTKNQAMKDCGDKIAWEHATEAGKSKMAGASCMKNYNTPECAGKASDLGASAQAANDRARVTCEKAKKSCEDECSKKPLYPDEKTKIEEALSKCKKDIDTKLAKLAAEKPGAQDTEQGGGDQKSQAKGNDADANKNNPMMMPPPAPKSDDEEQQPAPNQQAAVPPTETKKEEPKKEAEGKAGLEDQAKTTASPQSLNACSPLFAQKCPSGNTAACLASMSAADKAKVTADCSNTSALADPNVAKALTNNTGGMTGQSLPGNGTSGGGQMSGGADTSAMLDGPKVVDDELQKGKRDGSLNVDASGGSGGDYGSGGDSGSVFGDDPLAMKALGALGGARGLASAFQQQTVDAGKSVVDRYGPSVFSIVDETMRNRCARNLHYNCPRRK